MQDHNINNLTITVHEHTLKKIKGQVRPRTGHEGPERD
jgi:hypothetical protein